MNNFNFQLDKVEAAIRDVSNEISFMKNETNWESLTEEQLWSELVLCILGSKVRDDIVKWHFNDLKNKDLLNHKAISNNTNKAENKISRKLNKPIVTENKIIPKYPFSKIRASYIIRTFNSLYKTDLSGLKEILNSARNSFEARDLLIDTCTGIGAKQASLFLRNILYCDNLAILDSRVTKYMYLSGLVKDRIEIGNKKQYIGYEKILREYANSFNKPIGVLDLSIWTVMKVINEESNEYGNSSYVWWH